MSQVIDEIKYGNMSQESLYWVNNQTYLDKHFTSLTTFTFPANNSKTVKDELNQLTDAIARIKDNTGLLRTYQDFDRKSFLFYRELIDNTAAITDKDEFNQILTDIIKDCSPLVYKLKEYFQRPRPFQLAAAYKLRLNPFKSMSQDSPSYPSATVYYARIILEVIGNRCPTLYGDMRAIFADIVDSRLAMGLNYKSDLDVAICAADKVLEDQEFKIKFKL